MTLWPIIISIIKDISMGKLKDREVESVQNENYEESEMGQLHSLHLSENGINKVRSKLATGPGLSHCMDCGVEIPEKRRKAVSGVKYCIDCQAWWDKKNS